MGLLCGLGANAFGTATIQLWFAVELLEASVERMAKLKQAM